MLLLLHLQSTSLARAGIVAAVLVGVALCFPTSAVAAVHTGRPMPESPIELELRLGVNEAITKISSEVEMLVELWGLVPQERRAVLRELFRGIVHGETSLGQSPLTAGVALDSMTAADRDYFNSKITSLLRKALRAITEWESTVLPELMIE